MGIKQTSGHYVIKALQLTQVLSIFDFWFLYVK
jgi:hypothetical protein